MAKGQGWVCASRGYRSGDTLYFNEDKSLVVTTEDLQDRGLDLRLVVSTALNVNVLQKRVSLIASGKVFQGWAPLRAPKRPVPGAVLKLRYEGE